MYPLSKSDSFSPVRQSSVLCDINFENSQPQMFAGLASKADLWLKTRPRAPLPRNTKQDQKASLAQVWGRGRPVPDFPVPTVPIASFRFFSTGQQLKEEWEVPWSTVIIFYYYFSITVNIQHYISFRGTAEWLDIFISYKVIPQYV